MSVRVILEYTEEPVQLEVILDQNLMDSPLNSTRPLKKNKHQYSRSFSTKQRGKEHCQTHSMKPVFHLSPNWTRTQQKKRITGQSL
jgi:hypothetical protein